MKVLLLILFWDQCIMLTIFWDHFEIFLDQCILLFEISKMMWTLFGDLLWRIPYSVDLKTKLV